MAIRLPKAFARQATSRTRPHSRHRVNGRPTIAATATTRTRRMSDDREHDEAQTGHSDLDRPVGVKRREFLKVLGATGAATTLVGCYSDKIEKLIPYVASPD